MASPIIIAATLAGTRTITCPHCRYRMLRGSAPPRRCARCGRRLSVR